MGTIPCKGATLNDLPEMADMEVSKKNGVPRNHPNSTVLALQPMVLGIPHLKKAIMYM